MKRIFSMLLYGVMLVCFYACEKTEPTPTKYQLTVCSHDEYRGIVTGSGEYAEGEQVTVSAVPNADYVFIQWSDSVTDNPRNLILTSDTTIIAYFDLQKHTITLCVNDASMGIVVGAGEYYKWERVTIQASANEGYYFAKWNDGNTDNPRNIIIKSDTTFTAQFKKDNSCVINGYEAIDLGFESGTLWGTYDVGATGIGEKGEYFAWGETVSKDKYAYLTYQLAVYQEQDDDFVFTKYNQTDKKTILDKEDDVANKRWGSEWRIPTNAEWLELYNLADNGGITWDEETQCAIITGRSGRSIAFPLAGFRNESSIPYDKNKAAYYWSSELENEVDYNGDKIYSEAIPYHIHRRQTDIYLDGYFPYPYFNRCYGLTIRPVHSFK